MIQAHQFESHSFRIPLDCQVGCMRLKTKGKEMAICLCQKHHRRTCLLSGASRGKPAASAFFTTIIFWGRSVEFLKTFLDTFQVAPESLEEVWSKSDLVGLRCFVFDGVFVCLFVFLQRNIVCKLPPTCHNKNDFPSQHLCTVYTSTVLAFI